MSIRLLPAQILLGFWVVFFFFVTSLKQEVPIFLTSHFFLHHISKYFNWGKKENSSSKP